MSEVRDYGFGGAIPPKSNTSPPIRPSNIDLEAQSSPASVQIQEKENRRPISPIEYVNFGDDSSNFVRCFELQDMFWNIGLFIVFNR